MKKGLFTALVMMVISLGAFANNGTDEGKAKVSNTVKVKFNNDFYGADNAIWTTTSKFKKVTFTKDGVTKTAFYDWQNELVATTQLVEITALSPDAIRKLIKYYPGYQMGEIVKYSGSDDVYFVNLKNDKENFLIQISSNNSVSFFKAL